MVNNNNVNVRHFEFKALPLSESSSKLSTYNFLLSLFQSKHPFRSEIHIINARYLENLRGKKKCPIIPQPNINSLKNKFGFFLLQINKNVDTLLLSEPKLNDSFPVAQF